jgi:glyoxylase-like metal-dependent hydrolase (beta-lactamase superfamily II)
MDAGRGPGVSAAVMLLFCGCAGVSPVPVEANRELSEQRIGPDVLLVEHDPGFAPANILAVRMPDGTLVLCSSPYDTVTTRRMVQRLRERFRPAKIVAINVHFHPDGTAGNEGYAAEGVQTYGSDLTREALARRGREVWEVTARAAPPAAAARIRATPILPAVQTFLAKEGLRLTFGGEVVAVVYPGPAHSPDNVVVHFPSRRLLFGGDLVRAAGAGVGYRGDADLSGWAAAVRTVMALDANLVVPGHGRSGGRELLEHTRTIVDAALSSPAKR